MKKCTFITLGCKVNQYETQALREAIISHGYEEVPSGSPADLYVVNTCTVTSKSDEKSRQQIRRVIRKNPDAKVVVTGCSAEVNGEKIRAMGGVDGVFEKGQDREIVDFVKSGFELPANSGIVSDGPLIPQAETVEREESRFSLKISRFEGHTRAFLKIEDGCDNFCSYCIIPYVRGEITSKKIEDVQLEAERVVENGYKEIVLTGIHLGAYGKESGYQRTILEVLDKLQQISGLMRIRLSSIEVNEVTDNLINMVANSEKICPHFHLPLQSGDDGVLKSMNRRYDTFRYLDTVDKIRDKIDLPAISTDVMVGYPGEENEQFENTRRFCEKVCFSRVHIFPFSPRDGTPAATMLNRCTSFDLKKRKQDLESVATGSSLRYRSLFVGRSVSALVEDKRERGTGKLCGYSDRYLRVVFDGDDKLMNTIVDVEVEKVFPDFVLSKRSLPNTK
ncbi:MAG: tRNA (N(6)-L-threonylcarbamoyladenosine(37)-C(2))-methylthiotransferase MtaB [Candidatus Scalindua sp. AMX11]|nr:MAG: tRNA (N(6)-L-threonylcarbamoyladenosine(37)-C(2))-methylthiotransferase MtaB [Candidatus Scalindua sp.]NOG83308.1 tRNA (N(6)-L-threonylcarbamoyladenosine(37)-C(2))-methylthiotransferase MtaB [Planctomycetota bacterium]RZV76792.1 MAG: tRNA (N(6)-L-threonylcarbamoyladenosine(37)-C(2))-methylthiotransferase MtaB [Candidatus Scalindua sp. SCAELEC01]TDE63453.1 MAG: tRNA (N(6)-L-threonylcarbamoyladenosine(37)-C(2))-methylthiotransferase MtaB [Candidatus Scalindua sp. AMX11]GJQ57476.1 MAG: tRN